MSDQKELSLLEKMKKQHQMYSQQRDQAQLNFQQLVGAIHAIEEIIKIHEAVVKEASENSEINEQA